MKLYRELAEYYFYIENKHRNLNADINLIKSYFPVKPQVSVLDLGCGSGEHIAQLAKAGCRCTGIDDSDAMLDVAKKRSDSYVRFLNQSMTDFDFYEEFDIVTCMFGSFDYMTEDADIEKVFWNTWRALMPKGIGIFEIWNSEPILIIKEKPVSHISTTYFNGAKIERERGFRLITDPLRTLVEVNYRYHLSGSVSIKRLEDKHVMRAFTYAEIVSHITENGFILKTVFANSSKENFTPTSNRMIIVFEKN